jgi:hypothetical protein
MDMELEAVVKPVSGSDRGDGTEEAFSDEELPSSPSPLTPTPASPPTQYRWTSWSGRAWARPVATFCPAGTCRPPWVGVGCFRAGAAGPYS